MEPSQHESGTRRLTFLLSLWCDEGGCVWRAALRPGDGGPRLGFAGLDELVAFLLRLADSEAAFTFNDQPSSEATTA